MKKLKILIICDRGFEFGGTEIAILNQKYGLESKGHLVKIFSSNFRPRKEHFNDYEFNGFNENSFSKWINQLFNFRSYFKIKEVLKEFKPDIIHLHNIFYQISPSILINLGNVPVVMKICSYEMICPMGAIPNSSIRCNYKFGKHCLKCIGSFKGYYYEKIKHKIHKFLLKNVAIFIAPSYSIKKNFEKQEIIKNKIVVIYEGLELMKYSKIKNTKRILYIGRLSKEKGIDYLINGMLKIIKEHPEASLNIVGEGPEKDNLINLTKRLKIENNVIFWGRVEYKDVRRHYLKSDIVVVPSICPESFSLVGIEAMGVGRPVIGTKLGAIPEWLDNGKTGYLVEPKNSKQISEKVIKLFSNKKLLEKMGRNARKKAEQFSREKHIINLEKLYKKILKKCRN